MTAQPMDTQPAADPVDVKPEANAELRAYADRVKAENADLRRQVIHGHLTQIGLSPDEGLGKAIAKEYGGDLTPEAVTEYAKSEYGYEYDGPSTEPAAAQLQQQQDKIDQLNSESAPIAPETMADKLQKHDQTLAQPEATREDAIKSVNDKLEYYLQTFR